MEVEREEKTDTEDNGTADQPGPERLVGHGLHYLGGDSALGNSTFGGDGVRYNSDAIIVTIEYSIVASHEGIT
jgi:hypothetical protein